MPVPTANSLINSYFGLILTSTVISALLTTGIDKLFFVLNKRDDINRAREEKLYAPLRLKLSTMREIDKHIETIKQAGDEASNEARQIRDLNLNQMEQSKAISARFEYSREADDKWRECVKEVYELLQSYPSLTRNEHQKARNTFIAAYIAVHYFEGKTSQETKNLYPVKHYFDKKILPHFEQSIKELEKIILGV